MVESNALIKKYDDDIKKDSRSFLKQKEIFNKLINEKYDKILKLNEEIDFNNLKYSLKMKIYPKLILVILIMHLICLIRQKMVK